MLAATTGLAATLAEVTALATMTTAAATTTTAALASFATLVGILGVGCVAFLGATLVAAIVATRALFATLATATTIAAVTAFGVVTLVGGRLGILGFDTEESLKPSKEAALFGGHILLACGLGSLGGFRGLGESGLGGGLASSSLRGGTTFVAALGTERGTLVTTLGAFAALAVFAGLTIFRTLAAFTAFATFAAFTALGAVFPALGGTLGLGRRENVEGGRALLLGGGRGGGFADRGDRRDLFGGDGSDCLDGFFNKGRGAHWSGRLGRGDGGNRGRDGLGLLGGCGLSLDLDHRSRCCGSSLDDGGEGVDEGRGRADDLDGGRCVVTGGSGRGCDLAGALAAGEAGTA